MVFIHVTFSDSYECIQYFQTFLGLVTRVHGNSKYLLSIQASTTWEFRGNVMSRAKRWVSVFLQLGKVTFSVKLPNYITHISPIPLSSLHDFFQTTILSACIAFFRTKKITLFHRYCLWDIVHLVLQQSSLFQGISVFLVYFYYVWLGLVHALLQCWRQRSHSFLGFQSSHS